MHPGMRARRCLTALASSLALLFCLPDWRLFAALHHALLPAWIPAPEQVDRVMLEGNRVASTGEPIPAAEPGAGDRYLYMDT